MLSILSIAHVIEAQLLTNFQSRKYHWCELCYWLESTQHANPACQQQMVLMASYKKHFALQIDGVLNSLSDSNDCKYM